MERLQKIVVLGLMALLVGIVLFSQKAQVEAPTTDTEIIDTVREEETSAPTGSSGGEENSENPSRTFQLALEARVQSELGQPIEGYEPFMFMEVYPGLQPVDFDGVDALIGTYALRDGTLQHVPDSTEPIHSAAQTISPQGMEELFMHVVNRLKADPQNIEEILTRLETASGNGQ